ncbi:MAG: tRNA 2-thiouridine(34) synthase MnmA, partial [Oligoflexia bacterium]|nr:tRNA 2-thiouridine(34) synthase MnmA [Oligoflexia bacterium]
MKKRVLVALSGGVDSSVAALLLKSRGFEITGVTMRVSEGGEISVADAAKFCNDAGIHHIVLDLEKEFKEIVIGNFIRDYRLGRTPNPCALCNRHFKFGFLLNEAVNNGCDFLATGHYAKIVVDNGRTYIGRAADGGKDQSYFLFGIRPSALERIIFPLGDITKDEVRGIAVDNNLCCLEREESQDICFMSGGDYRDFVRQFLKNGTEQGDIKHVNGRIMGRHNGLYNYTIGQKRGLGLNHHESLYVIRIDRERNELIVG